MRAATSEFGRERHGASPQDFCRKRGTPDMAGQGPRPDPTLMTLSRHKREDFAAMLAALIVQ
jgi:hypothetical protein